MHHLKGSVPIPVTLINTRDCFVHDLIVKESILNLGEGRENVIKREYYFSKESLPQNYLSVVGLPKNADLDNMENLRVGITTYENFYSHADLRHMESCIEETERCSSDNMFLPMTA